MTHKPLTLLLSFTICMSPSSALKVSLSSQSKGTLVEDLRMHRCVDQSNERLGPLLSTVKKVLSTQGANVMPWALTALASVRFGGLKMDFAEKTKHYDHDVDLLVTLGDRHPTPQDIEQILDKAIVYLQEKKGLRAYKCVRSYDGNMAQPGNLVNYSWYNAHLVVEKETEASARLDLWNGIPSEEVKATIRKNFPYLSDECVDHYETGKFTHLDFWWKMDGQIFPQKPKTTQKMTLAGEEFDVFVDDEVLLESWRDNICLAWGSQFSKSKGMDTSTFCNRQVEYCDFSKPHFAGKPYLTFDADDTVPTNMINSPVPRSMAADVEADVFKDCAQMLNTKGFKSFAAC